MKPLLLICLLGLSVQALAQPVTVTITATSVNVSWAPSRKDQGLKDYLELGRRRIIRNEIIPRYERDIKAIDEAVYRIVELLNGANETRKIWPSYSTQAKAAYEALVGATPEARITRLADDIANGMNNRATLVDILKDYKKQIGDAP